jgi:hypothetical protein
MAPTSAQKSAQKKRIYNQERYANMDSTIKERRKKQMRDYHKKRIYGEGSSMSTNDSHVYHGPIEMNNQHDEQLDKDIYLGKFFFTYYCLFLCHYMKFKI